MAKAIQTSTGRLISSENANGSPSIIALPTQGSRVSGFTMVVGTPNPKINFKVMVPQSLDASPQVKLIAHFLTLTTNSSNTAQVNLDFRPTAASEVIDQSFSTINSTAQTVPNTQYSLVTFEYTFTTQPASGDFINGQLTRVSTASNAVNLLLMDVILVATVDVV